MKCQFHRRGCDKDVLDLLLAACVISDYYIVEFILTNKYEWIRTVSKCMGRTVAHYAFAMGNMKMIELLLRKLRPEDYWMFSKTDCTSSIPVALALAMKHPEPLLYLIERKSSTDILPINFKDTKGRNLLHLSFVYQQYSLAEKLMATFPHLANDRSIVSDFCLKEYKFQHLDFHPKLKLYISNFICAQKIYVNDKGHRLLYRPGVMLLNFGSGNVPCSFDVFQRIIKHENMHFIEMLKTERMDLTMILTGENLREMGFLTKENMRELGFHQEDQKLFANILIISILSNATQYAMDIIKTFPEALVFKGPCDKSPLFYAVLMNNYQLVQQILLQCPEEHKWILSSTDIQGVSPFHLAISRKYFEIANLFLENGFVGRCPMGWTYRHLTAYYLGFTDGNDEVGMMNYSPLHLGGQFNTGVEYNSLSVLGNTPLETQIKLLGTKLDSFNVQTETLESENSNKVERKNLKKKKKKK